MVKCGHESRTCETELGTLQVEHRGASVRDIRYEWVRRVWPERMWARAVSQRLFYRRKYTRMRLLVLLNVFYWW